MNQELIVGGVTFSVVILIVIEAIKRAGLPSKYAPVGAVALGALFGVVAGGTLVSIALGIMSGGMASGLYSWIKPEAPASPTE